MSLWICAFVFIWVLVSYIVEDLNVRNVCVCYMADAKLMKLELILKLNTLVAVRNRVLLQPAVSSLSSSHNNQRLPNAIFDGKPQSCSSWQLFSSNKRYLAILLVLQPHPEAAYQRRLWLSCAWSLKINYETLGTTPISCAICRNRRTSHI